MRKKNFQNAIVCISFCSAVLPERRKIVIYFSVGVSLTSAKFILGKVEESIFSAKDMAKRSTVPPLTPRENFFPNELTVYSEGDSLTPFFLCRLVLSCVPRDTNLNKLPFAFH